MKRAVASLFLVLLTACLSGTSTCCAEIRITLRNNPVVTSRQIKLSDVADVSSTSDAQQKFASQIDLKPIPAGKRTLALTRSYVQIRLMLAGWSRDDIFIQGRALTTVSYDPPRPISDTDVENAARKTMLQVMGVPEENLKVSLLRSFVDSLPPSLKTMPGLRVDVIPPADVKLGQTSLTVTLWDAERQLKSQRVQFQVLRRHRVAVARTSIQRDSALTPAAFHFENRFLAKRVDELSEDELLGMTPRNQLNRDDIIELKLLRKTAPRTLTPVIRKRDRVQATYSRGGLFLQLQNAEALEDGRIGDVIPLRNPGENGREFSALVLGPGRVEIRM